MYESLIQALLTLGRQNALLFSALPSVRTQFHSASWIRDQGFKGSCCLPHQTTHFWLCGTAEIICNNLTIFQFHCRHKAWNDPCLIKTLNNKNPPTHTKTLKPSNYTFFFNFYPPLHQLLNCDMHTPLFSSLESFNLNQKDACSSHERQ